MAKGIFITGTDTDAGKSIVTAAIMYVLRSNGYEATYFKAALSGAVKKNGMLIPGDTELVGKVSGLKEKYENTTPYVYETAVSPHLAAKMEQKPMDVNIVMDKFHHLNEKYDYVVAEGSGGIVCPLISNDTETYLLQDLIRDLGMNVIVVARASLGTINHAVITVKYIQSQGIDVKGIIVNGYEKSELCDDNIEMIKKLAGVPVLAVLPWMEGLEQDEQAKLERIRCTAEKVLKVEELIKCMDEI